MKKITVDPVGIIQEECISMAERVIEKQGLAGLESARKLFDILFPFQPMYDKKGKLVPRTENNTIENWQKMKSLLESVLQYDGE
jgi:hypothetical protein